jgi:hypothetical protein
MKLTAGKYVNSSPDQIALYDAAKPEFGLLVSIPPPDGKRVTNIYVDKDGKLMVQFRDTPGE